MPDRLYCTVAEVYADLGLNGEDEAAVFGFVRSASDFIDREIGRFIPVTATRYFDGDGTKRLTLNNRDPLLAATAIINDTTTLNATDYILYPRTPKWENGPRTRILIDPDSATVLIWTKERDIVTITGRWGMYEETILVGETVTIAADDTATVEAANGANLSPGMVLLIETEQLLVTATSTSPTDSTATVATAIAVGDDTIAVSDGTQVSIGETLRINLEQMEVVDIATNTLYVNRGVNGTARAAHSVSDLVYAYRTYSITRGINGTTAAAHTAKAVSRYIPPHDVNYLCRQIAALMKRKADSGYAGKTGGAEIGEVFYHQEFPSQIKKIKSNYRLLAL